MFSKRICEIAKLIKPYKIIADVGCDHGYLIIESFLNSDISKAIAIDNKIGPLNSAKKNLEKYNFNVRFSLSSGVSDIDDDTEVVVISGMGGLLISKIISDDLTNNKKLYNVKRLILQANRNNFELRKFLMENNYQIIDEKIIYEDDKYYEIIVCERVNEKIIYTFEELYFGPMLLKRKDDIFISRINSELIKLKKLNSDSLEVKEKIDRLEKIIC